MIRPRYFEWIDGEKAGTVETLLNITSFEGEYFYNFESGEVCNLRFIARMTRSRGELKNKVMVEINSPRDPWKIEKIEMGVFKTADEQFIDVPPLEDITGATGTGNNISLGNTHLGQTRLRAPQFGGPYPELPSLDDYFVSEDEDEQPQKTKKKLTRRSTKPSVVEESRDEDGVYVPEEVESLKDVQAPVEEKAQPVVQQPAPQANHGGTLGLGAPIPEEFKPQAPSPIEILAKTCKKHPTDINLTITIDLPSRSMFKMVSDEFENGGEAFVNCLISKLDINEVIDSIRNSLLIAYLKDEPAENE